MSKATHIPSLDGVRGIAILLIVFLHGVGDLRGLTVAEETFIEIAKYGWIGVDLFFVLSGFLITRILLDQRGRPGYFRRFYWRRALRIFPLFYFAIITTLIVIPSIGGKRLYTTAIWQHCLYVMNLVPGARTVFPGVNTGHFWSLCVEEHFYLVWPAVVLLAGRKRLPVVCAVLLISSVVLRRILPFYDLGEGFLLKFTPTRFDGLVVGSAMAAGAIPTTVKILAGLYPMALFVVPEIEFALRPDVACLLSAVVVQSAIKYSPSWLCDGVLPVLGKYSYGIYVWHFLFAQSTVMAVTVLATNLGFWTACAFGVSSMLGSGLCMAFASYHLLERPFLAMKSIRSSPAPEVSMAPVPVVLQLGDAQ